VRSFRVWEGNTKKGAHITHNTNVAAFTYDAFFSCARVDITANNSWDSSPDVKGEGNEK
jgi:hypothetical protein